MGNNNPELRIPWFSLAGLEQFEASQRDENGNNEAENAEGAPMARGDSGESNDSLGDVPIELRYDQKMPWGWQFLP